MADETPLDRAKAKAFTMRMVRHLEGASVCIMLEVGRRVGLFEAMATMGAVTSAQIAEKTGAKLLVFIPSVGGLPDIKDYFGLFDYDVKLLADALAAAKKGSAQ